jgi:peptide/nickel transport system substrate-binding protein
VTNDINEGSDGEGFGVEDLGGPIVDRRTTIQLLSAVGLGSLAGCSGDSDTSTGTEAPGGTETEGGATAQDESTPETTDTPPGSDRLGGRLKAGWKDSQAENLDPAFSGGSANLQLGANLYNGLLMVDESLRLQGDLATDWSVSDDGRTLTFQLHEGVTFHDDWEGVNGNEFTPEDFRYSLRRTREEESTYKSNYNPIRPLDEGGVEVVDDTTLRINMEFPFAPMLVFLTRTYGRGAVVQCKGAVEELGEDFRASPVGTGAFKVAQNNQGGMLQLDAHENYFKTDGDGNQLPYLDGIDVSFLPESSTLANALIAGDVHYINSVPQSQVPTLAPSESVAIDAAPGGNWFTFQFTLNDEPLSSLKFRQGVNMLVDRDAFINRAILGYGRVAKGPIAPAMGRYGRANSEKTNADLQTYDPERGRQFIEDAGYGNLLDGDDAAFTVNVTTTWANGLRMGRVLRQLLAEEGLTIEVNQLPVSTFWDRWEKRDYDAQISSSSGDADPDQSLYPYWRKKDDGGVWNMTYYGEGVGETRHADQVHRMLATQRETTELEERAGMIHEIEDMIMEDATHIFLYHQDDMIARANNVQGYPNIAFVNRFETVWMEEN